MFICSVTIRNWNPLLFWLTRTKRQIGTAWHGVAIELEFDIERARGMTLTGNSHSAAVAGRFGI